MSEQREKSIGAPASDPVDGGIERELSRIRDEYQQRATGKVPAGRYGLFNEAALAHTQGVERAMLSLLKRRGLTNLADKTVLDVGCGGGFHLRRFLDYGARPEHLFGIDLLPQRIETAKALHPGINWMVGSAHELPYADRSIDIVTCFTVLSSILDRSAREKVAAEMCRVRKEDGVIICHDFLYGNPRNPSVRSVTHGELRQLYNWPGVRMEARRVTLAPPLARAIAPRVEWLASALERIQVFNTHMVALLF